MHDEKLLSAGQDSLRFLDARFEPLDPVFDADEPAFHRFRRTRARGAAAAVALAATLACGGSAPAPVQAGDAILVQLAEGAAPPAAEPRTGDGPPILALPQVAAADEPPLLRVPLEPGADPAAAAAAAAAQTGVAFAEPVYLYRSRRTPNDSRYRELWGLAKINVPAAWDRSTGARSVVVAVVDDGVALDHSDLEPNLWHNPEELGNNDRDDDDDGYVDDVNGWDFVDGDADPSPASSGDERWHGTHVSGTIGALGNNGAGVVGVNWNVSLMALRAIGPRGGRSDDLAKAIDFAVEHGARVINASWGGGGGSQAIASAVSRAERKGVLFVAAAGNDAEASPSFPANLKLDNLISVGATGPDDLLASFSDRGAMVAAPGVGILSTTAPGKYERYDGTSMAAPHVSGLAALLWSVHPDATLAQVRNAIFASGVPVKGVQHGRIDAARALAALDGEAAGGGAALKLSRDQLTFAVRPGRVPRAQTVAVAKVGGGTVAFTAAADAKWILLSRTEGETPARLSVRVDPRGLGSGKHQAQVTFTAGEASARLTVTAQVGNAPVVAVQGEGCALSEGKLRVRAGAGCALVAAEGASPGVQWTLPGGAQIGGSQLYGQFVRRGEFEVLLSSDEGVVDSVPVVIE
ncbi:MAG TPA: S8 family serine peptidase [Myxococcales bacterium]|nr:S8 family serine peptidase [Myxococcales bacterium]